MENLIETNYEIIILEKMPSNAPKIMKEGIRKMKMPFWISAGTALGLYRDKDFVQNDTDIDVAVIGYDGIDEDLKSRLKGFRLIRDVYYNERPMQLAFKKDEVIFDIFIHWEKGDDYVNYSEPGMTKMPKIMYDKPTKIKTKYGILPFPHDPEEYFNIRYGEDWFIPQDKKPNYFPYA